MYKGEIVSTPWQSTTTLFCHSYKCLYLSAASTSLACMPGSVWEWPPSATTWNSASGHLCMCGEKLRVVGDHYQSQNCSESLSTNGYHSQLQGFPLTNILVEFSLSFFAKGRVRLHTSTLYMYCSGTHIIMYVLCEPCKGQSHAHQNALSLRTRGGDTVTALYWECSGGLRD